MNCPVLSLTIMFAGSYGIVVASLGRWGDGAVFFHFSLVCYVCLPSFFFFFFFFF